MGDRDKNFEDPMPTTLVITRTKYHLLGFFWTPFMYKTILTIDEDSFLVLTFYWQTHLNFLNFWSIVSQIMCKFNQKIANLSSFISSWIYPVAERHKTCIAILWIRAKRKAFRCFVWIWNVPLYYDRHLINMQVFRVEELQTSRAKLI